MPVRPLSHTQRQYHARSPDDHAYNHLQRKRDPRLWAAQQVRNTARWRRLRRMVLNRHPLCADPYAVHVVAGRFEPAVEVDHIKPLIERLDLAYEETNLQGLCRACHSKKSAMERKQGAIRASRGSRGRVSSD